MKYQNIFKDYFVSIGVYSDGEVEIEYDNGVDTHMTSIGKESSKRLYEELKKYYEKGKN